MPNAGGRRQWVSKIPRPSSQVKDADRISGRAQPEVVAARPLDLLILWKLRTRQRSGFEKLTLESLKFSESLNTCGVKVLREVVMGSE